MKKSKHNHFAKCFESNTKNLENALKGIKSKISLQNSASSSPNPLNFNNELTSDPLTILMFSIIILVQLEKKKL